MKRVLYLQLRSVLFTLLHCVRSVMFNMIQCYVSAVTFVLIGCVTAKSIRSFGTITALIWLHRSILTPPLCYTAAHGPKALRA